MLKNLGLKGYKEMSILSAKPEQLILMLYDGALRFLRQAIKSLEDNDIETAHHNFIRTQNILTELIASLNFDRGGEIALNLFRIYEFMHYTLVQANVKKEPESARHIYEQIKTLRDSWESALKNQRKKTDQANGEKKDTELPAAEDGKNKNIELTG